MKREGGRYEIKDGKRVLMHQTKTAPDPKPKKLEEAKKQEVTNELQK